jgi:hypothetical protein
MPRVVTPRGGVSPGGNRGHPTTRTRRTYAEFGEEWLTLCQFLLNCILDENMLFLCVRVLLVRLNPCLPQGMPKVSAKGRDARKVNAPFAFPSIAEQTKCDKGKFITLVLALHSSEKSIA